MGEKSVEQEIIYVKLLNEGVDVWRPVVSVKDNHSHGYLILQAPTNIVPAGEEWEFQPGSIVYVREANLNNGICLVAFRRQDVV